jgi:asparagine synthase (glutamine-hydrolysing)
VFGLAFWKRESREFAAGWDGSGVDQAVVDPERLREVWRLPSPLFGSATLLQRAWLAGQEK